MTHADRLIQLRSVPGKQGRNHVKKGGLESLLLGGALTVEGRHRSKGALSKCTIGLDGRCLHLEVLFQVQGATEWGSSSRAQASAFALKGIKIAIWKGRLGIEDFGRAFGAEKTGWKFQSVLHCGYVPAGKEVWEVQLTTVDSHVCCTNNCRQSPAEQPIIAARHWLNNLCLTAAGHQGRTVVTTCHG